MSHHGPSGSTGSHAHWFNQILRQVGPARQTKGPSKKKKARRRREPPVSYLTYKLPI